MKAPFSKLHLANSPEPLELGTTLTALCGKEVAHAESRFIWDRTVNHAVAKDDSVPEISPLTTCAKCLRALMPARYLYGIVSAPTEEAENLSGEERGEDVAF